MHTHTHTHTHNDMHDLCMHTHTCIYTHTHTHTHQDGRLKQGDRLLQINEESVVSLQYADVVSRLRAAGQGGLPIKLVVARLEEEAEDDEKEVVVPELPDVRRPSLPPLLFPSLPPSPPFSTLPSLPPSSPSLPPESPLSLPPLPSLPLSLFHCFPQSSDEEIEEYEVALSKPLGITIAGLVKADTEGTQLCSVVGF